MSAAVFPSRPGPPVPATAHGGARPSFVDAAGVLGVPVLVAAGVWAGSPLLASTGPLVVVLVVVEARRRRRWRADLAWAEALPASVDHLIQRLRSGASLSQACRSLGRDGGGAERRAVADLGPLRHLTDAMERGATLVEASRSLGRQPDPSLRLLATTLQLLATNGGPAVPALRRLRHTLVGRAHRRRRSQAQAASALSSAGLLVLAPATFALILAGTEPELAHFYLHDGMGAACATASVVLSAIGWWWIHHLVARFRWADG